MEFINDFVLLQTNTSPPCILVDCSEVELGRSLGQRTNRIDDSSPAAIKKRLEIYRLTTLPTLKVLDDQHRLFIVSKLASHYLSSYMYAVAYLTHGGVFVLTFSME